MSQLSIEKHNLLLIRGVIAGMSKEDQEKIQTTAARINAVVNEDPEIGAIALTLVGSLLSLPPEER